MGAPPASSFNISILITYRIKILGEEKVEHELEATPWRSGTTFLVASFNANELYNITGTKKVAIIS